MGFVMKDCKCEEAKLVYLCKNIRVRLTLKEEPSLERLYHGQALSSREAIRARGYKTFFILNSVEHEILNAHKYKNIQKFSFFQTQIS